MGSKRLKMTSKKEYYSRLLTTEHKDIISTLNVNAKLSISQCPERMKSKLKPRVCFR